MKKKTLVLITLLFAALFLLVNLFAKNSDSLLSVIKLAALGNSSVTIVIDPGHGGIDGGAESRGGICEKNINLAIALQLRDFAQVKGWKVIMTREEDLGLYEEGKGSFRSKKVQDLKKRQEIIKGAKADAAISIHLNSYPSQSVKGAQTFYSKSSMEGKRIAEMIQEKIKETIDPNNDRKALSKDDIAIMKNNSLPLVLVECGFLSNNQEAVLLQDQVYQEALAKCILISLEHYFIDIGKIKKVDYRVVEGGKMP